MLRRLLMLTLWPSFLMALPAGAIFFSLIDPKHLVIFGHAVEPGAEMGVYTASFLILWLFLALSSLLSLHMQHGFWARLHKESEESLVG